jgi:uncharacterized damage-inducible protein DinB
MTNEMDQYFENWDRIHKQSVKVMKVAPVDKFDWKPVSSAMSLGALMRHLPSAEVFLTGMIVQKELPKIDFDVLTTSEDIVEAFDKSHEECKKALSTLTEEEVMQNVDFAGRSVPRKALLQVLCEHEVHHRGQLYTYIRIAGVVPPALFGGV